MDESWRTHNLRRARRSTEDTNRSNLDPNDFDDVFGGPPRSVISRQYSVEGDFASSRSILFEDIFRKKPAISSGRTLPEFRIPASGGRRSNDDEEFYSDIFGNNSSRSTTRSLNKSRSKSNSSSILSSEDLSPFRPPVMEEEDDISFSSFASKLRPINVSSKWNMSEKMHEMANNQPNSPCKCDSFESTDYMPKFNKGCYSGSSKKASSPEIIFFGPNSYSSVRESMEDLQVNSPASMVSSLHQEQEDEASTVHDEEDDEVMSSYVIEINPGNRERVGEALCVDEAIAWAKQNCQTRDSEIKMNKTEDVEHKCPAVEEMPSVSKVPEVHIARHGSQDSPPLDQQKEWTTEEPLQEPDNDESQCKQMELELLDEDIKLWSDGKETNIRLLLSTLHHILWPSSGWIMIPLANLKDSSSVKKAYQKARLCMHPDKLQQRGATIAQKYVAEKAFPILQDAWAAFITQDVRSSLT